MTVREWNLVDCRIKKMNELNERMRVGYKSGPMPDVSYTHIVLIQHILQVVALDQLMY